MRHMRPGCDGAGVYATGPVPPGRRNALTNQLARAGHARGVPRPIVHASTCADVHTTDRGRAHRRRAARGNRGPGGGSPGPGAAA